MHIQLRHFLFKISSLPVEKVLRLYSSIDLILHSLDLYLDKRSIWIADLANLEGADVLRRALDREDDCELR